jgi:hypothetical protein
VGHVPAGRGAKATANPLAARQAAAYLIAGARYKAVAHNKTPILPLLISEATHLGSKLQLFHTKSRVCCVLA